MAPASGVAMNLPVGTADNAKITFTGGGIASASVNPNLNSFLIKKLAVSAFTGTTSLKTSTTVSVPVASGLFTGSFTLLDVDSITLKPTPRTGNYKGVIIPDTSGTNPTDGIGYGYFLLSTMPTPATSPVLSGLVKLERKP